MGIRVNPDEWGAVFAVPSSVADEHLRRASGQQLKVLPLNFKTAVSMMKNGYSAIGMNSFSNSSLVLSKEMITSIVNSEGYRREFS